MTTEPVEIDGRKFVRAEWRKPRYGEYVEWDDPPLHVAMGRWMVDFGTTCTLPEMWILKEADAG